MNRAPLFAALVVATIAVAVVGAPPAHAADELTVQILVDKPRPAADDVVRLTYTFSGSGLGGTLRLPGSLPLKNLILAGGPSKSDQMSYVNGVFSRSLSLTYFLRPQVAGPAPRSEEASAIATCWQARCSSRRDKNRCAIYHDQKTPAGQLSVVRRARALRPGALCEL